MKSCHCKVKCTKKNNLRHRSVFLFYTVVFYFMQFSLFHLLYQLSYLTIIFSYLGCLILVILRIFLSLSQQKWETTAQCPTFNSPNSVCWEAVSKNSYDRKEPEVTFSRPKNVRAVDSWNGKCKPILAEFCHVAL